MEPVRWKQLQMVFDEALRHSSEERRARYLTALRETDPELADWAAQLLSQHEGLSGSWEVALAAKVLNDFGPSDPALPTQDLGPYRFLRFLGQGGMGTVFQAQHSVTGQLVAVKVLRAGELSAASRERFAIEQRALAKLNHPSIARLYASETLDDGTPCFVMEYVEGETLTARCSRRSSIRERILLFRQVCEAVQHAHEHAIIHRDLKPANILVKRDGSVRLLDFGIAKQLDTSETGTAITGALPAPLSLSYAAPEQVTGGNVGTHTDVYALGVTLYELLTRHVPLELNGLTPGAAEDVIRFREPEPPSCVVSKDETERGVDWNDLDVLCATAIHKDPVRRYRSVEGLIRDLDHWLRNEPLEARRDTVRYRLTKFAERNSKQIATAATILTIFAAGIIWFTASLAQARDTALRGQAKTKRIEQFVISLFGDGDVQTGPRKDATALTILDRGRKQAEALHGDPDFQAEVYEVLGRLYDGLGHFSESKQLLNRALSYRTSQSDSTKLMASDLSELGHVTAEQSQFSEAEKLERRALALLRRDPTASDEDWAEEESALGEDLMVSGRLKEAASTLRHALHLEKVAKTTNESVKANTLSLLASVQEDSGNFDESEKLNEQALAIHQGIYGNLHPSIADDLTSIGNLRQVQRRPKEAVGPYERAISIYKAWYGPGHPKTLGTLIYLGQALVMNGNYDAARSILVDAVAADKRLVGANDRPLIIGYSALGTLEERTMHFDQARSYFEQALNTARLLFPEKSRAVGMYLANLATFEHVSGHQARAEQLDRQAFGYLTATLPATHPEIAHLEYNLASVLFAERKYSEAKGELEASIAILVKRADESGELGKVRQLMAAVQQALRN